MEVFEKPVDFGSYRLFARVGHGGMAEVFLATSTKKGFHGQFLAIKKLHERLNSNKPFVNLLVHEAKIGVLLNHPGIAEVYDLGAFHKEFFLSMEYVHGKSLDRVLERVAAGLAPPVPEEVATFITLEMLRALAFAHSLKDVKDRELNIIHRDVTPGNILLEYKGNVKLSDFGIATAQGRLLPEFSDQALGKAVYIPPEQAVNDPVVQASDLYSLGVVYYEMLTGNLPFDSKSITGLYRKIVDGKIQDPKNISPQISEELSSIVLKSLHKVVGKRYQSAPEMFDAIHNHYLTRDGVDFNSRVVRSYYRKKLAEYLRRVFEEDIVEELEVIQNALRYSEQDQAKAELADTMPQEVPAGLRSSPESPDEISDVDERTVFEPDHTDEATRHYPLTEDERKRIIQGLPPREVIQESRSAEGFDMATIPEFDLEMSEERSSKMRAVEDKLEGASLGRDHKETLKQQMPALEISSQEELDAFERAAFAASYDPKRPPVVDDDEPTRSSEDPVVDPASLPPRQDFDNELHGQQTQRIPEYAAPPNPMVKKSLQFVAAAFIVAGFLAGALALYQWTQGLMHNSLSMLPTQRLSLVFAGEDGLSAQREFFKSITDSNDPLNISAIEKLFNNEYKRHTSGQERVLYLLAHDPLVIRTPLSSHQGASELFKGPEIFEFLNGSGLARKSAADATLFVYLFSPELQDVDGFKFPNEFNGKREQGLGFVFAPNDSSQRLEILRRIAREIARIYGATEKGNPQTGVPLPPDGLAEPNLDPIYPQSKAELMGGAIAIGPLQKKDIQSIDDLLIGDFTAKELGWVKKKSEN